VIRDIYTLYIQCYVEFCTPGRTIMESKKTTVYRFEPSVMSRPQAQGEGLELSNYGIVSNSALMKWGHFVTTNI